VIGVHRQFPRVEVEAKDVLLAVVIVVEVSGLPPLLVQSPIS
jgi:hypothetical protein